MCVFGLWTWGSHMNLVLSHYHKHTVYSSVAGKYRKTLSLPLINMLKHRSALWSSAVISNFCEFLLRHLHIETAALNLNWFWEDRDHNSCHAGRGWEGWEWNWKWPETSEWRRSHQLQLVLGNLLSLFCFGVYSTSSKSGHTY